MYFSEVLKAEKWIYSEIALTLVACCGQCIALLGRYKNSDNIFPLNFVPQDNIFDFPVLC
jgi:hypothetical protein